ncbi:hypothetical protein [Caedibacter taeniospiralis]|jgi:hypothetical protein|uniref:hypothetical protein n=1 Tax=Caedibacter taeniospiralis TaxID=28907 RepID=UPI0037C10F63
MRKVRLLQSVGVIACSVALFDGGYAKYFEDGYHGPFEDGKLGFCIYRSSSSSAEETFEFTQMPGTQCFYPIGHPSWTHGDTCTIPKKEGATITTIKVPAGGKGLFCQDKEYKDDKDDQGQPWHFGRISSASCKGKNAVMRIAVHSIERPEKSLVFSLGTTSSNTRWLKLYGDDYWNSQEISLKTLQLSSTDALSGTNEIYCPNDWCTSGESPGSTSYIIYAPDNNIPAELAGGIF